MTVIDTSAVVDLLVGDEAARDVQAILEQEGVMAAPDLLVFEVVAVLRRQVQRGQLTVERAQGAMDDFGELSVDLYPTLPLSQRAWELRDNFTVADAMFIALAERLHEPLITKDQALAAAARTHTSIVVSIVAGSEARGREPGSDEAGSQVGEDGRAQP